MDEHLSSTSAGTIEPMRSPISIVDVDRLDTWSRYRAGLCDTCAANCCTMPLEVQLSDLVRLGLVDPST